MKTEDETQCIECVRLRALVAEMQATMTTLLECVATYKFEHWAASIESACMDARTALEHANDIQA